MTFEMDTPEKVARMMLVIDYPHEDVKKLLLHDFPDCNPEQVIQLVQEQVDKDRALVDAQIEREGEAAILAEHDTGRTMHGG